MKHRKIKHFSRRISPLDAQPISHHRYQITSSNGKTIRRLVIHTSIRPRTKFNESKHSSPEFSNDQTASTQQSFSKFIPYTNSSTHFDTHHQFNFNRKDISEYVNESKRRRRFPLTIRRCLWIILCLCSTLFILSALAVILLATLIKSNSTTTTSNASIATSTSTSTLTTENTTIPTTAIVSTSSTAAATAFSLLNVTSSASTGYGYERIDFTCSGTLTNLTIEIYLQRIVGATYNNAYHSFSPTIISEYYTITTTQIIYTWTIISGQVVNCASPYYDVGAQFNLVGTKQNVTGDTYSITVTTSTGITTVLTGHF